MATTARRPQGLLVLAHLKSWTVLRNIRSCPRRATQLINAVQTLILTG
jgi:hypothetical protein